MMGAGAATLGPALEPHVECGREQNEDCSLGGSTSDSFERLLQSGNGRKSIYKVLVKGEFSTMKHSFYKRFLLVMRI